jgi:histone-lysine N-methyltransferase EZH2
MMVQERYIPRANSSIAPFPGLHLSISETPGAGWGLFATRPIAKGQLICEYAGERITQEEGDRRGLICDRFNQSYLFQSDKETVIDAQRFGNVARFINHSGKKPNCMVRVLQVNGMHTVCIFAALDIDAGRELFFDYHHGRAGLAPDWLEKERDKAAELLSLREQTKNSKQLEQAKSSKQKQGRSVAGATAHARKKQKQVSDGAADNGVSASAKKVDEEAPFANDASDLADIYID